MQAGPGTQQFEDEDDDEARLFTEALSDLSIISHSSRILFMRLEANIKNQDMEAFCQTIKDPAIRDVVANYQNKALRLALYRRNLDMAKILLTFQEVIAQLDPHHMISWFARMGDLNLLKLLLQFQAFCKVVATDDNRPLFWALANSDLDMVNFLLEFPAVRNSVAGNKNDLLNHMAIGGKLVMLKRLLACPLVQVELAVSGNNTLALAAKTGRVVILEELLKVPAVRSTVAARDNFVLNILAQCGHIDAFNYLLEYEEVHDTLVGHWYTTLTLAAKNNHINVVQRLVHYFGGELVGVTLENDFPLVYTQVLNERLATACSALLLNKLKASDGQRLPPDIQHKILVFLAHEKACGQHHEPVECKAGTGETRCKKTTNFIKRALKEREAQNTSIFKKLRKYFRCGC